MRARLLLWSCACVASLALAVPAWAQGGPQIDPDSPAGTEYELPVDSARDEASPRGSRGTGRAPLFGEGVTSTEDGAGSRSDTAGNGASGSRADRSPAASEARAGPPRTSVARANAAAPGTDAGQVLAIGAGAAGVLLLGGLAGLAWRRRSGER